MPTILNIETSTEVCSVALTSEGAVLEHYEEFKERNHAVLLSDFIKGCLDHLRRHEMKLDAVAVWVPVAIPDCGSGFLRLKDWRTLLIYLLLVLTRLS